MLGNNKENEKRIRIINQQIAKQENNLYIREKAILIKKKQNKKIEKNINRRGKKNSNERKKCKNV